MSDLNTKARRDFFLLMEKPSKYIYFRFCENNFYTNRGEGVAEITDIGVNFFREIYKENQGKFLFVDVLLNKHEGEMDFAEMILKKLHKKEVSILKAGKNLKINFRCPYIFDLK